MRLSSIVLVTVLSSISTASGDMHLDQPQLPAVDAAPWSESAGAAGQRALRSHDDRYSKDELDVADADDEERGLEFLKKVNLPKWAKTKWSDHKLRRAENLAANQKKFREDMELLEMLQTNYYDKWNKLGLNKEQARADLRANFAPKETIDDILYWYTPTKNIVK